MANEFKVKKGLIVEGSGSAVLDIQGSQGQLFSITDDLTGDIFSVSDISGVPILNVNADGTTTIDGTLTLTNAEVLDSTSDTSIKFLTRDSNGVVKYHTLGSNAFNSTAFTTNTGTTTADNSQTFTNKGGNISQWTNDSGYSTNSGTMSSWIIKEGNGTETATVTNGETVTIEDGTGIQSELTSTSSGGTITITNTSPNVVQTTITGNAGTATALQNARNISGTSFDGTSNITLNNSNIDNGAGYTTNTGTLTGNGTSTYIPFYNGTTSFSTTNKLTWDGTYLLTMGLKILGTAAQNSEATALMINGSNIVGTRELGSNAFNSTSIPSLSGNVTIGGDLTVSGNQIITNGSNADVKYSVWTGTTYGIGMTSGVTYGHLNDYAMTFCMNNESDRGFWWGYSGQTKSDGAMSLTTAGKLKVKSTIEAQEITAVDTILGRDSQFQRMVTFVTEPEDSESTKALVWEATDAPLKIRNIPTNNNQLTNGAGFTTNTGTLTGNGSTNRVPFYSGTTTLTTDSSFTYTASSDGLTVGKISYGAGSATAPSVYFGGQSNTGLYWTYSPESMYVTVNGSTKAQWYSNGYKVVAGALGVNVNPSGTDGRIDASNDIVAYSTSDERLKENVKPIDNALSKILKIGGYEFDWKPLTEEEKKTIHGNEGHDVGVLAQEIEKVLPEVVTQRDSGYKAVKYDKMVALLIEGMKEQQSQIEELKLEIKKLKGEI